MDLGPPALEKEPGMQTAYYWVILAAYATGNSVTRDRTFRQAEEKLMEDEFQKLEHLLKLKNIYYERRSPENVNFGQ